MIPALIILSIFQFVIIGVLCRYLYCVKNKENNKQAHDLAEITKKLEAMQETEMINRMIIDEAPIVMNLWDESHNLIATSQYAVELHKVPSKEEFIKNFFELSPAYQPGGVSSTKLANNMIKQAFAKGYARFDWTHCTVHGNLIQTEVIIKRITLHGKQMLISYALDMRKVHEALDKRNELELKLKEQELGDRLRHIFDAAPLLIQTWDEGLKALDCNETTLRFYKFKSKEEYHKRLYDVIPPLQPCGASSWGKWNEFLAEIIKNGRAYTDFEEIDGFGKAASLEVAGVNTVIDSRKVVITYSTDVTERKKMNDHLKIAVEAAERANSAKSIFLSNLSHEIRTPMNAITGMIAIGKFSSEIERKDYALRKIEETVDHMLQMIGGVLDMAKIEANKLTLMNTKFDIEKLLQKAVEITKVNAGKKKQVILSRFDPNTPQVLFGDNTRITQILMNLLSNAVKFTPDRGFITVNSQWKPREDNGGVLKIEVIDTGIGISRKHQEKLFSPFEQAGKTISRKYGGTGLGLAISKQLANLMGGEISVHSEAGQGSEFVFTIPLSLPDDGVDFADAGAEDYMNVSFAGRCILLAEDVEINREVVIGLLEHTGVVIDCAENGAEAVDMLKANPERYDLILMDIKMPVMDGLEATRQIRSLNIGKAREIPIVALTSSIFKEDVEASMEAGMNLHIMKPVTVDLLINSLYKYMR